MYTRILVATDGSDLSQKAATKAIDLAAAFKAELVVLQVVPPYPISYFEGGIAMDSAEIQRIETLWADKAKAHVDAIAQTALAQGVKTQAVTSRSDVVSNAILAVAKQHRCDLIVMASHGRRGITRLLLGSETQQVLTHTAQAVLVVR
ncbi:MAG: universal stress protein [Rhodoferax sp.]|jgi:nucleotide-binding universal stress UspA family protein|nr:universal stress protein [Rhodoferax sp.]